MVAKEFIDFFNTFIYANRVTIEDFSDRLNLLTVVFFLITAIIVSTKQYLFNAISCYIPVKPTGDNFNNYLTDYCWVHGTIPLRADERLPQTEAEWHVYDTTRRISYYQWVPFVLGLQCIMFFLPHLIWQAACAHRASGDLFALMQAAAGAAIAERDVRAKQVQRVTQFLEDMLEEHQDCHKQGARRRLVHEAYNRFGLCAVSKRMGTCLVMSYLATKVIILLNAIMQLYLIQVFLGFYSGGSLGENSLALGRTHQNAGETNSALGQQTAGFGFGLTVLQLIYSGQDWPQTLMFPRVTFCYVPEVHIVGTTNTYSAQCALPINMLNEKIYIFFWFWIVLLIAATVLSLVLWLIRMSMNTKRKDFVKRFLRIKGVKVANGQVTREDVEDFVDQYLRRDGVFLVRMLALNAGEIIAAEVTQTLFLNYAEKHPIINGSEKPKEFV